MGRKKKGLYVPGYGRLYGEEEKKMREILAKLWPAVDAGLMTPEQAWDIAQEEFEFWRSAWRWLKGKKKRR